MAFLQIKSDNPELSFLLYKNPASGMSIRKYRKGLFFGWYPKNDIQTYNLWFKDGDDEISFKKSNEDEFEYNDIKRYNDPLFIQGAINEYLRQFTNGESFEPEKDLVDTFDNEIIINQIAIFNVKYIDLVQRYFPQFNITTEELSPKNYRIKIQTRKTMRDLVNFTYIISIFYHCLSDFDTWVGEEEIERYATILNNIDAPYFIRYVIKSRIVRSPNKFNSVKESLEKCTYQNINLVFGDTHTQRANFITDHISGANEIIDLGCGDMRSYGLKLAKKLSKEDISYHGIDIDETAISEAQRRVRLNTLENVVFYRSLSEFIDTDYIQKFDIILSEVFEHIKLKEDTKIIKQLVKKVNFNKLLITTPNKDFNIYYNFTEDQTRLDDHIFEMTGLEFRDYFDKLLGGYSNIKYEFYDIGDNVNGVTPTQAIIITKL